MSNLEKFDKSMEDIRNKLIALQNSFKLNCLDEEDNIQFDVDSEEMRYAEREYLFLQAQLELTAEAKTFNQIVSHTGKLYSVISNSLNPVVIPEPLMHSEIMVKEATNDVFVNASTVSTYSCIFYYRGKDMRKLTLTLSLGRQRSNNFPYVVDAFLVEINRKVDSAFIMMCKDKVVEAMEGMPSLTVQLPAYVFREHLL